MRPGGDVRRWGTPKVLMYHYFGEAPGPDPERLFVSKENFAAQLAHLRRNGWHALTLDEYLDALEGRPTPRRSFLLTIDDGHESVARIAAPMLAEAGVPAVLFVCPALVGGEVHWSTNYLGERLSGADELAKLPGMGIDLGVHGSDHTRMTVLDDAGLRTHTEVARKELEGLTGVRARSFAYPYGTHVEQSREAVGAAGFDVAFAVARENGRFAVDRVFVQSTDTMFWFRLKLSTGYRLLSRVAGRAWKIRHRGRAAVAIARRRVGAREGP